MILVDGNGFLPIFFTFWFFVVVTEFCAHIVLHFDEDFHFLNCNCVGRGVAIESRGLLLLCLLPLHNNMEVIVL